MNREEIREIGKKEVAYNRQLALLGKKEADTVLYFWMAGYKYQNSQVVHEDFEKGKITTNVINRDRNYLINMYNATSTANEHDELETYEAWLERQLLSRIDKLEKLSDQEKEAACLVECISCDKHFDFEAMEEDDDGNYFCSSCYKELSPVMKAQYDEAMKRGEIEESKS